MSKFQETDLGVSLMSREELDAIALKGGVVGNFGGGYYKWPTKIPHRHGYKFKVVGTHQCGNRGWLVLLPGCRRTHVLLREGRINWLKDEFEVTSVVAGILANNMNHSFCHEKDVIQTAIDTWDSPAWDFFNPDRVRHWAEEWRWGPLGMSVPRFLAVYHLVSALRESLS